jgi:hypothetical protein
MMMEKLVEELAGNPNPEKTCPNAALSTTKSK